MKTEYRCKKCNDTFFDFETEEKGIYPRCGVKMRITHQLREDGEWDGENEEGEEE